MKTVTLLTAVLLAPLVAICARPTLNDKRLICKRRLSKRTKRGG